MNLSTCLQFGYHTLRMKLSRRYRAPLTTTIVLLLKCPFKCVYCPLHRESSVGLPLETLQGVLRDIRELGGLRIHLTGGEPLLRDDLVDVVRYAKDLGLMVSMSTTGFRGERQLAALRKIDRIQLSYDGPPDVRAALSTPAAANTADEAIALFKEHDIRFGMTTVLTRLNIPHLDWLLEQADRHRSEISFVVMETLPEEWGGEDAVPESVRRIAPSLEETREVIGRLIRLKKGGAPIASSMPYLRELLEWPHYPDLRSPQRAKRYRCLAWQSQCELFANGQLHVCTWTMHRRTDVSILPHGFRHAWEHLGRPEKCESCFVPCNLEANLLFGLNFRTITNWAGRLLGSGRKA